MNEPTNVQEHAPSPAAACSDPQPASERPDQPDNKAAGEGRVARLVRCSSVSPRGAVSYESVMTLAVVSALIVGVTLGMQIGRLLPLRRPPQEAQAVKPLMTSPRLPENDSPPGSAPCVSDCIDLQNDWNRHFARLPDAVRFALGLPQESPTPHD